MSNSTKKVMYSGLAVIAFAIGTNYVVQKNQTPTPFWKHSEGAQGRTPANFLTEIETELYKDYFLPDKFKNYLDYDVQIRFSTDKDSAYINENAAKALHAALSKTFTELNAGDDPSASLTALIKKNLVAEVMDKFVKTLYIYKIFDGNFQVDFIFTPKAISSLNYNHELSTNQLINLDDSGSLYDKLTKKQVTLTEQIKNNKVPNNGELYQYIAGAISLNIELADMTPAFKVPDPKKNIVKGEVKFRKYYRINDRSLLNLNLKKKGLSIDTVHLRDENESKEHLMTVDVVKTFNLKEIMPQNDKLEITFGEVKDLKIEKRNLWSRFMSFVNGEDITTSSLNFYGKYDGEEYKAKINKLVYSFKEKKFTGDSQISLKMDFSVQDRNKLKTSKDYLYKKDLLENKDEIITQLKLDTFFKNLK